MDGEAHILANRRKAGGSPVRSRSLPRPTLAKTPKAQREDGGQRTEDGEHLDYAKQSQFPEGQDER